MQTVGVSRKRFRTMAATHLGYPQSKAVAIIPLDQIGEVLFIRERFGCYKDLREKQAISY